ncbi:MAG: hypothetical protein QXR30_01395 [Candidatus Woesearchaeota archaeon]
MVQNYDEKNSKKLNLEIYEKIMKEVDKRISIAENNILKKIQSKTETLEENVIIPETAILLSLIELLKQKEIFTEEELDEMLKKINPKEYEKLKQQYELFNNEKKKQKEEEK